MFGLLRNLLSSSSREVTPVAESVVEVPQDVMNAAFDRSAGRWCGECEQNGSHHTDKHNEFAEAALAFDRIRQAEEARDRFMVEAYRSDALTGK